MELSKSTWQKIRDHARQFLLYIHRIGKGRRSMFWILFTAIGPEVNPFLLISGCSVHLKGSIWYKIVVMI